nr:hypothetical protein [uncultured Acetatifactor sp.]
MSTELMTGFIIWLAGGGLLTAVGIGAFFSKKEVGFWANVKPLPMRDVKAYNRATGRLFIVDGVLFILLGLPLLWGAHSAWILIPILGVVAEIIVSMAVYTIVIQNKYEKK